jgi:hypothetical protein
MASFTPTSSPSVVSITRKTIPAQQRGFEWWSGNGTHAASVKVKLDYTKIQDSRVLDGFALTIADRPVEGKWRKLPRHASHDNGYIFVKDYRGIVKEADTQNQNDMAERLFADATKPIHTIYHARPAVIPAYDEVSTLYEEEGWGDAWVFYYGAAAEVGTAMRDNGEIERIAASMVVSLSNTRSALTPNRAVVLRFGRHYWDKDPFGFCAYASRTDFVVDGKVVRQHYGQYSEEFSEFRLAWVENMPTHKARYGRRWTEMVSPKKETPTIGRHEFRLLDGGVLMSEISSKNITDMPMNPFGEGSVAKNRKPLADGLAYITETPDAVPDYAVGKARENYLFKKELMERVLHPDRVAKMVEKYGIEWVDA